MVYFSDMIRQDSVLKGLIRGQANPGKFRFWKFLFLSLILRKETNAEL
jgi:hypothetical protein